MNAIMGMTALWLPWLIWGTGAGDGLPARDLDFLQAPVEPDQQIFWI